MDYNSITNQSIKSKLIEREVYHCQTSVVEELLKIEKNQEVLYELDNFWYYRLDLSDGEFIGDYDDLQEKVGEVYEKIEELESAKSKAELDGLSLNNPFITKTEDEITALEDDLREMDNPETEAREIFEWWLVSPWFSEKLKQNGEVIWNEYGCYWWGRCTTGQAVLLDHVISNIALGMKILEGMENSWEANK